jgi:putative ABC transport system permease protein
MALGATPGAIRRLFVSRAIRLTATGAALGAVASVPATRIVSGLLFGVSPGNPAALSAAVAVLIAVAAAAADIPSRRAARTDPLVALRRE